MLQEITTTTSYYRHATYSFASLIYIYYFHGVCIKSELLGQDGITRGVKVKLFLRIYSISQTPDAFAHRRILRNHRNFNEFPRCRGSSKCKSSYHKLFRIKVRL